MRVRYTRKAAAELVAILDYIATRSPVGAANVMARIDAVTEFLLRQPQAGRPTSRASVRRFPVTPYPYLIYYKTAADEIVVHGVRHGSRRQTKRLGTT